MGFASLACWVCKLEEQGATDMKGDRKFNFDSACDVIMGEGGKKNTLFGHLGLPCDTNNICKLGKVGRR